MNTSSYYPSLVGVSLLSDILPDLPLPSCQPSPLEAMILGQSTDGIRPEMNHLLNNSDPHLCSQISKALSSVDTSFLKLKVTPPKQGYRPELASPLLIKNLLKSKSFLPELKINLKKINTSGMIMPSPITATPTSNSIESPIARSDSTPLKRMHPPPSAISILKEQLGGATTATTGLKHRPRSPPSFDEHTPPKKRSRKDFKGDKGLIVSIEKHKVEGLKRESKPNRKKVFKSRRNSASSSKNLSLLVSIERDKLSSSTTKAVHGQYYPFYHHNEGNTLISDTERKFKLASPNLQDQIVPAAAITYKKEKKKKKKHKQQDTLHQLHIQKYTNIVISILEQVDNHIDSDDMLNRSTVSHLIAETIKLKQLKVLHQVHSDVLIKLISVMDRHVLDTASLLLTAIPEDVDVKEWREATKDRILCSLDASLVILHITTTPQMPTHVHLEESIDQVISHAKYHLENNIYPEFDPVYRAETKESGALPRQKRRYTSTNTNKVLMAVYNRLVEVIDILSSLLQLQSLTDTTVLKLSGLGIFPFFVENVSSLQLSALKLVQNIFSKYERHRELILDDIFSSLGRLPTTKRNLRSFRLSNGQNIQMVTALILQLVQCMVIAPNSDRTGSHSTGTNTSTDKNKKGDTAVSTDISMINSYELALRTGSTFLSTFMKKCCSGKEMDDFRPLFDNFVQDLLTTLNLPEWPASEVLLALLGVLLVQSFSNRSNDQQLRLTSLDHLGVIAARLRTDAISSVKEDHEQLIDVLSEILQKKLDGISPLPSPTDVNRMDAFSENSRHLRKALIAYLTKRIESDPSVTYAKYFYLGQWIRDNQIELEKILQTTATGDTDQLTLPDVLGTDQYSSVIHTGLDVGGHAIHLAEKNRDFLIELVKPLSTSVIGPLAAVLDDKRATIVTKYLTSGRALSKSFDMYLQQLLRVLNEPAVHVRTKAMKALSTIVAADPNILSKTDLQRAVQNRFSDSSTLMREAAVDLVGRFILIQPELTSQYYNMLIERILDTGVSVRKRVIKILKDICSSQPNFDKITEICTKMLRRINDEEGIKQLVTNIFYQLWFTVPVVDQREHLIKRVINITDVISKSVTEQECFELLLQELMKNEELNKSVLEVCQLMVDSLVERVLSLDEVSDSKSLVDSVTTLFLFSKIQPSFLTGHAKTLLPYLSSQCNSQEDIVLIHYIARILESVIPLMLRPTETFLASLEEDLVKLIMKQGPMIVQSCVSCLSVVVNKVSHNYKLVNECYLKFYSYLEKVQYLHKHDPESPQLVTVKPSVLRSLFTVGLFCKHFDIDSIITENKGTIPMSTKVYSLLIFFCYNKDEEIRIKALIGLGFHCVRYPQMMLNKGAKDLYISHLSPESSLKMKCQVIKNIQTHLMELESTLKEADAKRLNNESTDSNLMEIGDQQSSVSSNISQLFLPSILNSCCTAEAQIRLLSTQTILLILRQGLVHPGQCIPYLIALSTDSDQQIKVKAEQQLTEYTTRYGSIMQTHLSQGLKKTYELQQLLSPSIPRGYTESITVTQSSILSHLYTLVRSSKPQRRAFLQTVLRPFEDYNEKVPLGMLLFLADSLSCFPYLVFEEPLFVLHNVDLIISVTGASVLQSFREALGKTGLAAADDEDNEEEIQRLSQEIYCDIVLLNECCKSSLSCILLLLLKQHLKLSYNLTDKKCQEYTPTENNKAWDKSVTRKQGVKYDPWTVVRELERELIGNRIERKVEECIQLYIYFKQLMNKLDPSEDNVDSDEIVVTKNKELWMTSDKTPPSTPPPPVTGGTTSQRRRSRSRTSSTSSGTSIGQKKRKLSSKKSSTKKKKIILSDDSDLDD